MHHYMMYPTFKACIGLVITCSVYLCSCHSDHASVPVSADTTAMPELKKQEPIALVSALDKSPLDVIYFPAEYPKLKMLGSVTAPPVFRVLYSRPQRSGRQIFGNVVKYGEPWRLGANEATEIEFFEDVYIQQTKVPKGRYTLYCIPQTEAWTLIINSELYEWGLKIDAAKDMFTFTVPTIKVEKPIEEFTMETKESTTGANLWIGWDDTKVMLPVDIHKF